MATKQNTRPWFFIPDTSTWKHLATFRTITGGDDLRGLYSFIEDFRRDTQSATQVRRAEFGNGWVLDHSGKWHPLIKAHFTGSGATWEAKDSVDAGLLGQSFYLQTGGDTHESRPVGSTIERTVDGQAAPQLPRWLVIDQ